MIYSSAENCLRIHLTTALTCAFCFTAHAGIYAQSTTVGAQSETTEDRPWLDRKLDVDRRVHFLVESMSLEEKIGQLWQVSGIDPAIAATDEGRAARGALVEDIRSGKVGSMLNEVDPKTISSLQDIAVHESRLGIPLIFGRDVIHGFRTIFPIPLGQAASWNPELAENAAAIAAREARSVGIDWTFAPMVDIARDPRWGRIAESLGEDPYLASAFSAAMVRGYQGRDLSSSDRIAACAKHFAGYGAGEGGRDYNSAAISPSALFNVYLPPFHAAVHENVATLMTAFNDVNGIPGTGNSHLLRDVLRNDWGFKGFVVSDWESVREMIVHGYCRNEKDAARTAVRAGVNMEMVSRTYHDHLKSLVESGEISQSMVDELVASVLRVKIQLGLFEQPSTLSTNVKLLADDHLQVARRLAEQSIVLLKNKDRLLPLDKSKLKKLAVIGPFADDQRAQLGAWALDGHADDCRTPLAAIRDSVGPDAEVLYEPGIEDYLDRGTLSFDKSVAVARQADAVLLFVGEGADLSGEAHSRAILDLPGAQNELIDAIAATGKPIVLIVQAGRPLTIGHQVEKVAAILYSFHAGTMAGPAIADLIWGKDSPSGKIPVTFPKVVGQIPLYYNHTSTGRPPRPYDFARDSDVDETIKRDLGNNSNYMDASPYPLFPFGYGLSYTTFGYDHVELSSSKLLSEASITVRAQITNTGIVAADEIAQLYIHEVAGSLVRPIRELKGFLRMHLEPGESKTIEFPIACNDLMFFNNQEQPVLESGSFEVYVGGNSLAPLVGEFEFVK